jgi:hypothetical protein
MLKPTSYLTVTLAGPFANSTVASAVKRTYSYLAPTTIVKGTEDCKQNAMRLDVRLPSKPFMDAQSNEENTVWSEVVLPWLKLKLSTLFGSVYEFNNEARRSFTVRVDYGSIAVVLQGIPFEVELEPDSSLRDAARQIDAARTWLSQHADDEHGAATRVRIPSDVSRGEADWFDVVFADGTTVRA